MPESCKESLMAAEIWKDREVAKAFLTERSLLIPDRPRQLEVLLRVLRLSCPQARRILDLGAGDGILLAALLEAFPQAGGFIKEGKFARMKVGDVEDALAAATGKEPSAKMKDTLLALYLKLAPSLAQALQARTEDRATGLQKKLVERANKEAGDIEAILAELKRAILKEMDHPEYAQPTLFDTLEERAQFEKNKLSLQGRLQEIPAEIERETAAVRARYADPQPRMFPVAVTFLVPDRMG
jgi:hypothetical protein